jgi:hypothetical protein
MTTKKHNKLKLFIAERDKFTCQVCGKYLGLSGCIADRISQSKVNRKKFGNEIIDNPLNKVYTCISVCNDSFNLGYNPYKTKKLIDLILNNNNNLSAKDIIIYLEN